MNLTTAANLVETALLVGLLYSAFTIGLSLSFRVLNFPDLGIEGSAILGGALCAWTLQSTGNPWLALFSGALGGSVAGLLTGFQHVYLGVSKLLSGIITSAIFYSINIRILGGRANARVRVPTIFDVLNPIQNRWVEIVISASLVSLVVVGGILFFKTKIGFLMRALGSNTTFVVALGRNPKVITLVGLAISNAVIGFGGAVLVQQKHLCDVNMSAGILISALAALVLAEVLVPARGMTQHLLALVAGTTLYSLAVTLVLFSWNSDWENIILSSDVRLVTGVLLLIPTVILRQKRDRFRLFKSDW